MKSFNNRGFAWLPVLALVALAALLAPKFHLPAFLQKQPPTKQLTQAEDELAKARAAQAKAESDLQAAKVKEAAQLQAQLQYAHQMNAGAGQALARVPAEHLTPEVRLASEMVARTENGLTAAIGGLPEAQQAEIKKLVADALSAVTGERDEALKSLAEKDADLQKATVEKQAIQAQLPALQASVETSAAAVEVKSAEVQTKTHEVAAYAEAKAAAEAKAGSLDAYAGNLLRILLIAGLLYLVVHFVLPSLAQEFPASKVLTLLNKSAKSVFSSHT